MGLQFLDVLQVAVECDTSASSSLPDVDWRRVLKTAQKQSVEGIVFPVFEKYAFANVVNPELLYSWIAIVDGIEKQNEVVNHRAAELTEFFSLGGYRGCILKGQGAALLYPNPLLRRSGDIDIWVGGERDEIVEYIRSKGIRVYDVHLVHATAEFFPDVPVEVHFQPSWMYNPKLNRHLQEFFKSQAPVQFANYDKTAGFAYPTVFFNLVHSMVHINRHVFEEGVGLRQLMDYYFILKHSSPGERTDAYKVLSSVGLKKFAAAVMYVMQRVFQLDDDLMLCEPSPTQGTQLLDSVMAGGNFGNDFNLKHGRNKLEKGLLQLKHNFQLMLPYANEAMWIPFFQVWHYGWRKRHGYL